MDFLQKMISYYQNESGHNSLKVISAVVLLLLLGTFFSWKLVSPLSILKGLTIPLLIGGLFFGIAGAANGIYTNKTFSEKLKLYEWDKQAFFKEEVPKVEKIHKCWFAVRLVWTLVALGGMGLMLFAKKNYVIGVGLGILTFGLMGQIVEAFSYHRNEQYRDAVLQEVKSHQVDHKDGEHSEENPLEKSSEPPLQEKSIRPHSEQKRSFFFVKQTLMKDKIWFPGAELISIRKIDFVDTIKTSTVDTILIKDSLQRTGRANNHPEKNTKICLFKAACLKFRIVQN